MKFSIFLSLNNKKLKTKIKNPRLFEKKDNAKQQS